LIRLGCRECTRNDQVWCNLAMAHAAVDWSGPSNSCWLRPFVSHPRICVSASAMSSAIRGQSKCSQHQGGGQQLVTLTMSCVCCHPLWYANIGCPPRAHARGLSPSPLNHRHPQPFPHELANATMKALYWMTSGNEKKSP
jgi:hypothetical protein